MRNNFSYFCKIIPSNVNNNEKKNSNNINKVSVSSRSFVPNMCTHCIMLSYHTITSYQKESRSYNNMESVKSRKPIKCGTIHTISYSKTCIKILESLKTCKNCS